jgi:antitoxin PrlF
MSSATLSAKGRITLPAAVRTGLGLKTGDRIDFVQIAAGRYELVAATLPATALRGLLRGPTRTVGADQMSAAARKRAAKGTSP